MLMVIEGELIILGFMMLIGQIILMMMWQNNWFKKENFKIQKTVILAENRLNLRKLEKSLGLEKTKTIIPKETPGLLGSLGELLPLLKGLEPEQIGALADRFLGTGAPVETGGSRDVTDMLMDFAGKNPEMVQELLNGISGGFKGDTGGGFTAQG